MSLAHIPDPVAHPPILTLPVPPAPAPPLPKRKIFKYLPLPVLIAILSLSLYLTNSKTRVATQASETDCPTYNISPAGYFTSTNPNRQVQITLNGSPIGVFPSQNQNLTLPSQGLHTWQVIDNHNCLSSGSYTAVMPVFSGQNQQLPPTIPTLAK